MGNSYGLLHDYLIWQIKCIEKISFDVKRVSAIKKSTLLWSPVLKFNGLKRPVEAATITVITKFNY
jgi:hypothetical protein